MTPPAVPTVGALLEDATHRLAAAGIPDARREAIALLAHALGTDRGGVITRVPDGLPVELAASARVLVAARVERRPLQHLTGRVLFHGLEFEVGPAVLIPRPETEGLVDAVLDAGLPEDARVADLGTGSGCIALALAAARPRWRLVAVDRSAEALAVARRNAARHGFPPRVRWVDGHFDDPAAGWPGPFDAVVSNPPYIPEEEWRGLTPEVREYEPKLALVPGPTGFEAYGQIVPAAREVLVTGGLLAIELGWTGEPGVRRIVEGAGFREVRVSPDLSGIPRVLTARR